MCSQSPSQCSQSAIKYAYGLHCQIINMTIFTPSISKAESPLSWCHHEILRFVRTGKFKCSKKLTPYLYQNSGFISVSVSACLHICIVSLILSNTFLDGFYLDNLNQETDLCIFLVWIMFRPFSFCSKHHQETDMKGSRAWCRYSSCWDKKASSNFLVRTKRSMN